eukprot:6714884-Prymnesium_polylepis.1
MACHTRPALAQRRRPLAITQRQDFIPSPRDCHGVLPLCARRAVGGHCRPAVTQKRDLWLARVEHRLDRERHALLQHDRSCLVAPGGGTIAVLHERRLVEGFPDAVALEERHHAKAVPPGVGGDGLSDAAQPRARCYLADPEEQALARHERKPSCRVRMTVDVGYLRAAVEGRVTNVPHHGRVAVPAVAGDHRQIHVYNVASRQIACAVWHTVADLLVDRYAHRPREAAQAGYVRQGQQQRQLVPPVRRQDADCLA